MAVHIQWLGGSVAPCLSDINSLAAGSKLFVWVARGTALSRGWGEVYSLRLSCLILKNKGMGVA